jgi:hypothetical protein
VIGEFGGFLEFAIGGVDVLLGLCGMAAELVLILALRFVDLSIGLLEMVLRFSKIRMPVPVNVHNWALGKGVSTQNQASRQQAAQHQVFDLHGFSLPHAI